MKLKCTLVILLSMIMILMCSCGQQTQRVELAQVQDETQQVVVTEQPVQTSVSTTVPVQTAAPTIAPVIQEGKSGFISITKQPSTDAAKTINSTGTNYIFISKATNYNKVIWYFRYNNNIYKVSDIYSVFYGTVSATGYETETLTITSNTTSIDGLEVWATFYNNDNSATSQVAYCKVVTIKSYSIICNKTSGGTVYADHSQAAPGTYIYVYFEPNPGYVAYAAYANNLELPIVSNGVGGFWMPEGNVLIDVYFKQVTSVHTIYCDDLGDGGYISLNNTTAATGDTVNFTLTKINPNATAAISIMTCNSKDVIGYWVSGDNYNFTMPNEDVYILINWTVLSE